MEKKRFARWLRQVSVLSRRQRLQLMDALRPAAGLGQVCEAIGGAAPDPRCPSCQARRSYRHGHCRELLAGIAEAAELFLLESQKGSRELDRPARRRGGVAATRGISREHVCVLVARDRTGGTRDFVTGRGAVTKAQLHRHLLPVLDPDVMLVTDGHLVYRAFAREADISHQFVNLRAGERVRGAVHVQK